MQAQGCDWARLQAAGAAPSLQSAREVKAGASAASPWQEEALRKRKTLLGKGVLLPAWLKKGVNSYWELNAQLNASRALVVFVHFQKCLITKQTCELYSQRQKSKIRAMVQVCEKIRPF